MNIINLIRERKSENEVWIDSFAIEDSVQNPEQSLRDAVSDFLKSQTGADAIKWTNGDFNWGDAIMLVPNDIWYKYGIIPLEMKSKNIMVNQDEILCDHDESVVL